MNLPADESCDSLRTLLKNEEVPSGGGGRGGYERSPKGFRGTQALHTNSREGTPPVRTPNRTPATKRKDLLAIGGIEIEKRRSSSSASYRIENNKVRP